jgi:integrase
MGTKSARARRKSRSKDWPAVVKIGSVEAKIYRHRKHGAYRFILSYYEGQRRRMRWFSDYDVARLEAAAVVATIVNGQSAGLELTGADRDSYIHARQLLTEVNVPLHSAVEEYVRSRKLLGSHPMLAAIEDFVRRHREKLPEITVEALVEEALKSKRQDGMSDKYLVQLDSDWGRFAKDFKRPVHTITTTEMETWLRGLEVAARTRNNFRTMLITLFSYARQRGYLPKGLPTEAESLAKAKVKENEIQVFEPAQITLLLKHATPDMIPFITLGAFAGVRVAEIHRLGWEAIRFEDNLIELKAGQAKTAARRLVPLELNLKAWLEKVRKTTGKVITEPENWKKVTNLAKELKIGWPQNVLRHSYITYRVARDNDVNKVALDCGNSPTIIFKHYRQLATAKQALAWFGATPEVVAAS